MSPSTACPLTAGVVVFVGEAAAVTTTSCSIVAERLSASVTVKVTYFVPTPVNVKFMV